VFSFIYSITILYAKLFFMHILISQMLCFSLL